MTTRARLAAAVAAARPRGWRCGMRVVDGGTVVLTIMSAPVDPIEFLMRAAQAGAPDSALASDMKLAHARRYCRPVAVPDAAAVEALAERIPQPLLEAGRALAGLNAALRSPGLDGLGRPVAPGSSYHVTLQIGDLGRPFELAPPRIRASAAPVEPVSAQGDDADDGMSERPRG